MDHSAPHTTLLTENDGASRRYPLRCTLCGFIHHVGDAADRQQAAHERVQALNPGGIIASADVSSMLDSVGQVLRDSSFRDIRRTGHIANLLGARKG